MKKLISVVLCVAACLVFASCGQFTSVFVVKNKHVSLTDIYESLKEIPHMPSMEIIPDEQIKSVFDLDLSDFEEYIFAQATDPSVNADTIILIKYKDTADLNSICDTLDAYLYNIKKNTASDDRFLNHAKTQRSAVTIPADNYVYLIITTEYLEAARIVNEKLTSDSEIKVATATLNAE